MLKHNEQVEYALEGIIVPSILYRLYMGIHFEVSLHYYVALQTQVYLRLFETEVPEHSAHSHQFLLGVFENLNEL